MGLTANVRAAGIEIAGLVLQWWICVTMPTRYLHYFNMLRKCQWPHVMRFVAVSASADKIDFYMRTYLHARVCRCTLLRVCTSPTQPVWNDRRSQCVAPDLIAWSFTEDVGARCSVKWIRFAYALTVNYVTNRALLMRIHWLIDFVQIIIYRYHVIYKGDSRMQDLDE